MNRDRIPPSTTCTNPKCFNTTPEATTVCRYCGTDKARKAQPACPYIPGRSCDCGGRGFCLDVA